MNDQKIRGVVRHLLASYPYPDDLSNARVTKLVYLSDWKMALGHGRTITGIDWVFNHYGPYVADVKRVIEGSPDLELRAETNMFGAPKHRVALANAAAAPPELSKLDKEAVDFIVDKTATKTFADFIDFVYDTYPIKSSERYSKLDLIALAKAKKSSKK